MCCAGPGTGSAAANLVIQEADPVLRQERAHLREARQCLRAMREDVASASARAQAGDRVSEQYLKADLWRRAEALADLPDAPLFFGRIDYREADATGAAASAAAWSADLAGERFHIGRRHIHDAAGRPVVIDWRAPVSRPFYRASTAEPMGVALRRRFGFAGGELTAYEDEDLAVGFGALGSAESAPGTGTSRILIEEIERPRSGPMRDIVATIAPEQDDIVRGDLAGTVCVQGAPGTGKTAVGLHRVAYLLYAHAERLRRGGVLVLGPNRAFLGYIRNVLPALGEVDVTQVTVDELLSRVPVRGVDSEHAGLVKGDARMAEVLRRSLWARVLAEPPEGLLLSRGSRRWRVPPAEIGSLVTELRARGVRYGSGREMLAHRIAHVILARMEASGETCDDRTHDAVRRTRPVREMVDRVWPKADPVRLVFALLSSPDVLSRAADGLLSGQEQAAIVWGRPPRGAGAARWSAADAVLIDEADDLIERTPSLAHVVIDEAQDLSPMQCRAIGRRCATGSATVLGDLAQGTTPWAASDWESLLSHLGQTSAQVRVLDVGYRVPRQILDFASRLLPLVAPGLGPARSVRQEAGSLSVLSVPSGQLDDAVAAACRDALSRPGSAGLVAADPDVEAAAAALSAAGVPAVTLDGSVSAGLTVVPVSLAKGLEFDHVIVVEPARIAAAEPRGLHRLYVALTRAVSRLTVLHAEPLPEPLR